jgi:hypothetical protein
VQSLWRDRDFMCVWSGSLVSEMGDQVTLLALPLAAELSWLAALWIVLSPLARQRDIPVSPSARESAG